jgi:hypothetical protein
MSLKEEIKENVTSYLNSKYEITDATVTPDKKSISFGPQAKKMWAVVVYMDIRDSRKLLDDSNLSIAEVKDLVDELKKKSSKDLKW